MPSLEQRFNALDDFLQQWQWLWREVPFKQPVLSWFEPHPQWKRRMDAMDDGQLQYLAGDVDALYAFARESLQIDIDADYLRPSGPLRGELRGDASDPAGISQRKWRQICAFGNALLGKHELPAVQSAPLPAIVEWCAGKGHLSRRLLQQRLCDSATGLEWDPRLIASANTKGIALHLQQQDVLDDTVARYCTPHSHHVALHACGKLHVSMLQHCSASAVDSIDLVPCCYHLVDEPVYRALSQRAWQSSLKLDQEALKLALQETVTAPANARRGRERLQRWRLGFDALQRQLRGSDDYLPVPSFPNSAHAGFREFCAHCASLKQLDIPSTIDLDHFEAEGNRRFHDVSRYDLIRQLFRRPIELWLVLDRCLFLQEMDYDVELAEFCPRELTPRNLWIHARRRGKARP